MYFDVDYWWRVVRHVWGLRTWHGRHAMLARLLLWIPLRTVFHGTCFMLDYLFFPQLWTQQVERPVFIVGHGRSGTTLMHRLMSTDDRFSYFLYWEMFFPSLLQKKVIRGIGWLDALIETFPDARIVVMMRNPVECIPSCLKLVQVTWKGKGWQPEQYAHSLERLTQISFEHFEHPREVLARHPGTPQIVVDYRKLTTEPRETVHAVYRALDIDMNEQFDGWRQAQAEQEKQHYSKFEYSLGEFHLHSDDIYTRLEAFYRQYQWPLPDTQPG